MVNSFDLASTQSVEVPVFSAQLPSTPSIIPYLQEIEAGRNYSNFGPLTMRFQQRLSAWLDLRTGERQGGLIATSSGSSAIIGAIMAHAGMAGGERPLAVCPGYTFAATALCARMCGYRLFLADVDLNSWMLDPEQLLQHPLLDQFGVILPVSSFGRAVDVAGWEHFQRETGIPVVIDAAAGIEALIEKRMAPSSTLPIAVSFHATKAFGCGEGGAIVWADFDQLLKCAQAVNNGFMQTRECQMAGLNGKMSEYHAAVALAEMDGWHSKKERYAAVAENYRDVFRPLENRVRLFLPPDIASNYVIMDTMGADSDAIVNALGSSGIGTRRWYGSGLQNHRYFADSLSDQLTITDIVSNRLIGLPAGPGLTADTIDRVAMAVHHGIAA